MKTILLCFLVLLFISCVSSSQNTAKNTPNNSRTFTKINNVKFKDIDKNNDKIINKEELEAYQDCNNPDSATPLYVILFVCGFTSLMCLLPKTCSFIKKKIKK